MKTEINESLNISISDRTKMYKFINPIYAGVIDEHYMRRKWESLIVDMSFNVAKRVYQSATFSSMGDLFLSLNILRDMPIIPILDSLQSE